MKEKKCDKSCKYYQEFRYTCTDCEDSNTCEYAFDDYCTDGDCLAIK